MRRKRYIISFPRNPLLRKAAKNNWYSRFSVSKLAIILGFYGLVDIGTEKKIPATVPSRGTSLLKKTFLFASVLYYDFFFRSHIYTVFFEKFVNFNFKPLSKLYQNLIFSMFNSRLQFLPPVSLKSFSNILKLNGGKSRSCPLPLRTSISSARLFPPS